jgi:serine/threonine protein kinase/Tfp pilus assembly protein PilF
MPSIDPIDPGPTSMSDCPSLNRIRGLLDERLDGPELAAMVNHVETCPRCQQRLESLTRGHGLQAKAPEVSSEARRDAGIDNQPNGPPTKEPADHCGDAPGVDDVTAEPAPAGEDTNAGITRSFAADPDRPVSSTGFPPSEPGSRRAEWPQVPGYDITKRLGEGGMGVVYEARQLGLNRMVALKMIRSDHHAQTEHVARFRIEAEAVARLRHPNILQIYDIGEVGGLPFFSVELLGGGSLADRLDGTPQPGRSSAELLATLALAIEAAHQAGIVHRDLKPSNVLFTSDATPKVTDFGLAKRLESTDHHTETGQVMGSPSYMAPEQARGNVRDIGPATDVYALGAILYEMLTGRPPFKGETPLETIRQVTDDDPVAPSRLVPRVARDLETISLKCLNKEPHKRYESARALADDLHRYLKGEPIKARPTPFWERAGKWARRRPFAAAAAVLIPLALLGSFIGILEWQRAEADSRERESDRVSGMESKGYRDVLAARRAMEELDLSTAEKTLSTLRGKLAGETSRTLKQLDADARSLLEQIEERRAQDRSRAADRARFEQFLRAWNVALFHNTQFTGLDVPANQNAGRQAALDALAVMAPPSAAGGKTLAPLPASLTTSQQDQIKEGCYELLLNVAAATDRPTECLQLLAQAARWRPPTMVYHLRRAALLSQVGDQAAAQLEQRAAAAMSATTALDHYLLGQEDYKRGNYAAANRHFETALQLRPGHFWARCLSSVCYLQLRQPTIAKLFLTECIERERDYPWLYVWRGFASYQLAAIADEQLRHQPPSRAKDVRDEARHQFEAALADYAHAERMLDQKPDNELRWVLLVNRGALYVGHEEWDKASGDFQAATQANDRRPEAFVGLARVYERQHKPNEAFVQFSRAIAVKPDSASLYRGRAEVNLGRVELTPQDRKQALADLDQAIRLEDPDNLIRALDHTRRALLLRQDHRDGEALAACESALQVRPDYRDAHHLRIQVLLDLKRYDDVIRSCDALLAKDKTSAALYELRGLARTGLKDFPGAIEDDTQAIALEPARALLFVRRGDLHLVSDAPKLALHDFDEAARLDPGDADALSGRGAARVRLGQHREAVADAEKALAIGKLTAHRLFGAARIYARAAAVAGGEVRKKGQDAVSLVDRYQDRGATLLRDAIKRLPAAERAAFWRDVVQADPDPAMGSLRRRLRSADLAGTGPSAAEALHKRSE